MEHRPSITSICALVVSITAVVLSAYSSYSDQKQNQLNTLVTIDQYLHAPEMSDARAAVREGKVAFTIKDPNVHRVCSSFDFCGTLVRNKAIDERMFLDYWRVPLKLLGERLAPVWSESMGGDVTAKEYYKDFYWLISEARKRP